MSAPSTPRCEFETRDLLVRLDLTLSGEVQSITPVVEDVMGIVNQMGCATGREIEVETALREALANRWKTTVLDPRGFTSLYVLNSLWAKERLKTA